MAYVTMYVMIFFRGEVRSSPISISSTEKLFIVQYIIEIEICARLSNLDVCYSVSSFNVAKAKIPNGYKTCSFLLISVWGLATRLNNGLLCLGIHSDCTIDCQILKHIALE
jgi:hypothetical protein